LAKLADDPEQARRLRVQSCSKYEQALTLASDDRDTIENWAVELLDLARLLLEQSPGLSDQERANERARALDKCSELLHDDARLRGLEAAQLYDYACLLAARGARTQALESLEVCLRESTIDAPHVREDLDWQAFRGDPAWESLLDRYPGGAQAPG
jgi:hypothetical protein